MTHYQNTDSSFPSIILNLLSWNMLSSARLVMLGNQDRALKAKDGVINRINNEEANYKTHRFSLTKLSYLWVLNLKSPFSQTTSLHNPYVFSTFAPLQIEAETLVPMLSNGRWWIATFDTRTPPPITTFSAIIPKPLMHTKHLLSFPY